VLALEGGVAKVLVAGEPTPSPELVQALVRKRLTPALRAQLTMSGYAGGGGSAREAVGEAADEEGGGEGRVELVT
jgi:hypothetical protein